LFKIYWKYKNLWFISDIAKRINRNKPITHCTILKTAKVKPHYFKNIMEGKELIYPASAEETVFWKEPNIISELSEFFCTKTAKIIRRNYQKKIIPLDSGYQKY
jgi:hypothetical protein